MNPVSQNQRGRTAHSAGRPLHPVLRGVSWAASAVGWWRPVFLYYKCFIPGKSGTWLTLTDLQDTLHRSIYLPIPGLGETDQQHPTAASPLGDAHLQVASCARCKMQKLPVLSVVSRAYTASQPRCDLAHIHAIVQSRPQRISTRRWLDGPHWAQIRRCLALAQAPSVNLLLTLRKSHDAAVETHRSAVKRDTMTRFHCICREAHPVTSLQSGICPSTPCHHNNMCMRALPKV